MAVAPSPMAAATVSVSPTGALSACGEFEAPLALCASSSWTGGPCSLKAVLRDCTIEPSPRVEA